MISQEARAPEQDLLYTAGGGVIEIWCAELKKSKQKFLRTHVESTDI